MTTEHPFILAARSWLGVRWRHQGRSREGIDCGGLVYCAAREIGIECEDLAGYALDSLGDTVLDVLGRYCDRFDVAQAKPADIIVRANSNRRHLGILGEANGRLTVIHADMGLRKVVEHGLSDDWRRDALGVFRVRFEI